MIVVSRLKTKKELFRIVIQKSSRLLLPRTILAAVKSLPMPKVKEVVLAADLKCANCQERVANVISAITDLESMVVHVTEKKVTLIRKSDTKGPTRCPVYNRIAQLSSQS